MKQNILLLDSQANNLFSQDLGAKVDLEKLFNHFYQLYAGDFEAHYFYQYHSGMNWDSYQSMVRRLEGYGWIVEQCLNDTNITSFSYAGIIEATTLVARAVQLADDLYIYPDAQKSLNLILGVTHLSYAPMLKILSEDCEDVNISLLCNSLKVSPKLQEYSDELINVARLDIALEQG